VVDALTFLGEEAGVEALVVERLDQLPLHLANHGDRKAPGASHRLPVLAQVRRVRRVELANLSHSRLLPLTRCSFGYGLKSAESRLRPPPTTRALLGRSLTITHAADDPSS
jgi:hypothetical protein